MLSRLTIVLLSVTVLSSCGQGTIDGCWKLANDYRFCSHNTCHKLIQKKVAGEWVRAEELDEYFLVLSYEVSDSQIVARGGLVVTPEQCDRLRKDSSLEQTVVINLPEYP